jgi:hypothetical protein
MPHACSCEGIALLCGGRRRGFVASKPQAELRKPAERQGHGVGSPLIVPDFDQFRKFAAVNGMQLFDQFRLDAGLLAHEKEYTKLSLRCDLAGDKDLRLPVFDEIDQLIFVLETHARPRP